MHRILIVAILALAAANNSWPLDLGDLHKDHSPACKTCGKQVYGTSVEWVASPAAAAEQAKKEEKLVFVLHVSGHFEDPAVT